MAKVKVSDQELKAILTELESELMSATGLLAKSEGDEGEDKPEKSKSESGDSGPPADGGGDSGGPPSDGGGAPPPPADGGGGDMPPAPGADAPPAPGPGAAPPGAAPMAPATPDAGGAIAPPPAAAPAAPVDPAAVAPAPAAPADPAALQSAYAALGPDELKAHYLAAKAALFTVMGGAQPAAPGAIPGAPPAPAPAPAAPAPAPMAPPAPGMLKGEKMPTEQNGKLPKTPTTPDIAKSEGDLSDLRAQFEVLTKAISLIANIPNQKAVTDLTYVAKSEDANQEPQLSPVAIKAKLNEIAKNPLTKNEDRNLMNKYVCGSVGVDAIKHLLK